jgi:xylulose-5-phosphate/fructose-6-phosphate phosphoketolase
MSRSSDIRVSSAVAARRLGSTRREATREGALSTALLDKVHRYWQAANHLTVGQLYLLDNPLLVEPLRPEHIKPRSLGHWVTSPGLSFVFA